MKKQDFDNHIRFYVPHHFIFYPVIAVLIGFALYEYFTVGTLVWLFLAGVVFMIGWLSFMLRQHYALTLQNRLVKQELRYRYFVLTQSRLEPLEEKLSDGQLFALRFAPDAEFAGLVERAINENLKPVEIKKAIHNWKGDYERV